MIQMTLFKQTYERPVYAVSRQRHSYCKQTQQILLKLMQSTPAAPAAVNPCIHLRVFIRIFNVLTQ